MNSNGERPRRSRRLRRVVVTVLLLTLGGTLALVLGSRFGPSGPIARVLGPIRTSGALSLQPIEFATDDYYIMPTRLRAEEGWLEVPENRATPTGRTLRIHFVRLPSTAARPSDPIIYLAGGPGGSGTLSLAGDRYPLVRALRSIADVVALDQRGTPLARRYSCPGSWDYPLDRPLEAEHLGEVLAPHLAQCVAHWRDSIDVTAFNTRENAEDIEDLRQALGVERVTLWGISYGTRLGLEYLRRHGDRVHRAILAGVEAPNQTYKLPVEVDRVMVRLDSTLRADRAVAERVGDVSARVRDLLDSLAVRPATLAIRHPRTGDSVSVTVGALDLQRALFFAVRERGDIERILLRLLPILEGDLSLLARFAILTRTENGEDVMALSMDCSAGASPGRLDSIRAQASVALLGNVANLDLEARCRAWPGGDVGAADRLPMRSGASVLFISGTLDPRTPPTHVEAIIGGFPNGRHLVIEGAAHDDDLFLSSRRIRQAMVKFLRTGDPGTRRIVLPALRFALP